jgi:hypothetical protein
MALSKETMKRIEACAIIAMADKSEKIEAMEESTGDDAMTCAIRYTIGALKAGIRRGTYRTYTDALDALEREQVGDRGQGIGGINSLERTIRRINHINQLPTTEWERAILAKKNEGKAPTEKKSHARNMAKVYGSLYVQWEESEEKVTPDYMYTLGEFNAYVLHYEDSIRAYIAEYMTRLSPTAVKAVREIVDAHYAIEEIAKAKEGDEAYTLQNKLKYLHRGFPQRDALSFKELGYIFRQYVA